MVPANASDVIFIRSSMATVQFCFLSVVTPCTIIQYTRSLFFCLLQSGAYFLATDILKLGPILAKIFFLMQQLFVYHYHIKIGKKKSHVEHFPLYLIYPIFS